MIYTRDNPERLWSKVGESGKFSFVIQPAEISPIITPI